MHLQDYVQTQLNITFLIIKINICQVNVTKLAQWLINKLPNDHIPHIKTQNMSFSYVKYLTVTVMQNENHHFVVITKLNI